jgi:hypothetical protein
MNPRDSTNLVAIWRDFRLGYRQVGYGYSFDGGLTWNQDLFVDPYYPYDSDPGLTVDTAGNFYAQVLGYTGSIEDTNGLIVYKSTDGGMTWNEPVSVVHGVPDVFEDKGLIACDRSGGPYTNNIYVAWARLSATKDIFLARSTDGGNSFEAPVAVSDIPGSQWPVPCVGANSEACVAWYQWAQQEIRFDRSTNGGQSFGVDITIQHLAWQGGNINGEILVIPFPATDVDITNGPYSGHIYVAYMDYAPGNTDTDIYFTRSTDGGTTWSQKVRINDDSLNNGCDQFHPWLIVAPDGSIIVVFLDRRLDPNNLLMDCYMTTSTDGGDTWSPNERITTVSSDPTAGSTLENYTEIGNPTMILATRAGLLGEYIGVTASSIDDIHPIWTDTRFGNQDVFVGIADTAGPCIQENITHELNAPMLLAAPNPFKDQTYIIYMIQDTGYKGQELRNSNFEMRKPMIKIYNASGRLVKSFRITHYAIRNTLSWDGQDDQNRLLPSGVYILQLKAKDYIATEKLLLIR